jgi:hypothetical protein
MGYTGRSCLKKKKKKKKQNPTLKSHSLANCYAECELISSEFMHQWYSNLSDDVVIFLLKPRENKK